jgi:pheromone a factor receptor
MPSTVLYDRWANLACGFLVFLFFGLGRDAKNMYREWLVKMGLARLFPVLVVVDGRGSLPRGGLSTDNSKMPLRRNVSWIKTER